MFFKTEDECREIISILGFREQSLFKEDDDGDKTRKSMRVVFEDKGIPSVVLARHIVSWLGPHPSRLLWITEFGVWPSLENLHLYYKFRNTYGDYRELIKVPGQHFLSYESEDLTSFLDLAIHFRWGAYVLTSPGFTNVEISHDGWMLIEYEDNEIQILKDIQSLELDIVGEPLMGMDGN